MEQLDSIGNLLQKGREKQGLSLDELANKTKISINMLRFLEANELDKLPNKTFVKGFVQNYSKCVGIDIHLASEALEKTYQSKLPQVEVPLESNSIKPAKKEEEKLSIEQLEVREKIVNFVRAAFDKRIIIGIIALVAFVGVIKAITSFFTQISKEQVNIAKITGKDTKTIKNKNADLFELEAAKKLRESNPAEKAEKKEAPVVETAVKAEVVKETPKQDSEVTSETKTAETEEDSKVENKTDEPAVKRIVSGKYPFIKFSSISGKLYDLVADAPETQDESLLPENIKEALQPGKANVFINASKGDTWISYKIDDQKIKRYVLKQGRTLLIKGDVILLFLGNINATTIFYNNQLVEVESRTGVKSLIFPQELSKNYELPLFPTFDGSPLSAEEYKANMAPEAEEEEQQVVEEEE